MPHSLRHSLLVSSSSAADHSSSLMYAPPHATEHCYHIRIYEPLSYVRAACPALEVRSRRHVCTHQLDKDTADDVASVPVYDG
jgi:hypothetical protein